MADFIDFIAEAANDFDLTKRFIKTLNESSPDDLQNWLKGEGYDVSVEDCKKLVDNKDNIVNVKDVSSQRDY